ncbi:ARPP-2 domain-containing protein [Streptomyces sp. NPDC051018]|uniref:ARPP-2 domain-containing protein n=1 Tax=Streptomyces sp. NPDC051018 TaxID=3365639 RepID=UPI00379CC571
MSRLDMTGLVAAPAQVWGGIRLVPLVRNAPVEGLRLRHEVYGGPVPAGGTSGTRAEYGPGDCDIRADDEDAGRADSTVDLGSGHRYVSYVPHGFVADWSGDGGRSAAYGTVLGDTAPEHVPVRRHHRLAKRRGPDRDGGGQRLRFLPLHLALEGYLALHFGGPSVMWDEWSQRAVRQGLSPRAEAAYGGWRVRGLEEALRVFEIHEGQCGVLVYAADSLASAFVVPHPDDYRALHPSLVEDLYGDLVHQHALFGRPVPAFEAVVRDENRVRTLADLRAAAREQEREWTRDHDAVMAAGLLDPSYAFERVRSLGSFTLRRFLPPFQRGVREQHIGEVITDHRGRVAYLKTFRLSEAQIRRGHLLSSLHDCDWHLDRTAAALGTGRADLVRRIHDAGFGWMLKQGVEHWPGK